MLTRRQCPPTQCSVNIDSQILETIKANSVLKGWQWLLRCLGGQWTWSMPNFMLEGEFFILQVLLYFLAILNSFLL